MIMKSSCKEDVSLFVTCGNNVYKKLDETEDFPVWKLFLKDKRVYFIEDKLSFNACWSVYYGDEEIGEVFGLKIYDEEDDEEDYETVLSIKLRIQEQMGIPANRVNVYEEGKEDFDGENSTPLRNNDRIVSESYIEIEEANGEFK